MRDFVCPDCGTVIENDTALNRKRCPRCAYEMEKKRAIESARQKRIQRREERKLHPELAKKPGRKPKEKPESPPIPRSTAQKELDAEQNARMSEQRRQCKSCRWRLTNSDRRCVIGCDFLSKNGHMRDRGEGPGKCGSYEQKKDGRRKK